MKKRTFLVMAWGLMGVLALSVAWLFGSAVLERDTVLSATNGDPRVAGFNDWPARYQQIDGNANYTVRLSFMKGVSHEFTEASGRAVINYETGHVSVTTQGLPELPEGYRYEVLLVDNQPGPDNSALLDTGPNSDDIISLGFLDPQQPVSVLEKQLDAERLSGFEVDLVMVRRSGPDDSHEFIIGGLPDLFYKWNRSNQVQVQEGMAPGDGSSPLSPNQVNDLTRLIRKGERLFFLETFAGNGRTCGTCHRAENNFTIDPKFIATLPDRDPLFVAEFVPELSKNFENPRLMRRFGLILENTNGFDPPETNFTMRGTPHTLALRTSINSTQALTPNEKCSADAPCPRLGWSGDGSPKDGSLRSFAIGAVIQHFTKTLNRKEGVDFRLPTDDELDALEAFQLSLGRQKDLQLPLKLKDPVAFNGQTIFSDATGGKCNTCHGNAGANLATLGNFNFDTGVENLNHPANISGMPVPSDDGFGSNPGDGTFNTPSLVEAADTGPFFHNNAIRTVEGSVEFYNSDAFNKSPSGQFIGGIDLEPVEVESVAAFLRVINALENTRQALELLDVATFEATTDVADATDPPPARVKRALRRAFAETEDAAHALDEASLHPDAVNLLNRALEQIEAAARATTKEDLARGINRAKRLITDARALLISE